MKQWSFLLMALVGMLALAACAAEEKATPTPAAPTAGQAAWEQEWERVVAAAKQEGRVSILGPTGPDARKALVDSFERKYGITVEFLAIPPPDEASRVTTEFQAGRHSWDVLVRGTTPALPVFKPAGILVPLEPALILPEVKEAKNWRGGRLPFSDKDKIVLAMTPYQRGILFVNSNLVKPEDLKSYRDLLDPKWKGKILLDDPRFPGPGNATFAFFYLHKELGPDFIRAFLKQEPAILRGDFRQELEWLGQGKYPILVGTSDGDALQLARQGLPIAVVDPTKVKEGSDVSPAWGSVALFKNAPHPNAAKVYINWLLTKEAQTEFARAMGYVSARVDVPTDHVPAWRIPREGAVDTAHEDAMDTRFRLLPALLKDLLGE